MKKSLLEYYQRYLVHFSNNLEKARSTLDEEAIHQYRVSIKRIRAVTRACEKVSGQEVFQPGQMELMKRIFKAGGSIRDQQVQDGIVAGTEEQKGIAFPTIREMIRSSLDGQKKYFLLATTDYDPGFAGELYQQVLVSLGTIDDQKLEAGIQSWINRSLKKLRSKKDTLSNAAELHDYRTRFKQAAYLLEMIHESRLESRVPKFAYDRLKVFGQELGEWHDQYMLLQRLSAILHEAVEEDLKSECRALVSIVAPVQQAYFDDVVTELKKGRIFDDL